MKIKYLSEDIVVEMEVDDCFGIDFNNMVKKQALTERKETRRHQSLEKSVEKGHQFRDMHALTEEDYIIEHDMQIALSTLTPAQRELINLVYYEGYSLTEVALQRRVSQAAVGQQMKRALNQLKRLL